MRILYLSLSYVPSRRASSVQVMKMCAAFARAGHEVVLVGKQGPEPGDPHAFYNVERTFEVEQVARPRPRGGGLLYAAGLGRAVLRRRRWADVVYCRDPLGALLAAKVGLPHVFEAHEIPTSKPLRALLRHLARTETAIGTVAISEALRRDLVADRLAYERIVVAHDACDPPRELAALGGRHSPPVIGYVGSLYRGRGVELIVEIARRMPECVFRIVGGSEPDLQRWRSMELPSNIEFLGFHPQRELAALYRGFDAVLMPHSTTGVAGATGTDISRWTSPMKMFEYMASGVPLVASGLPVLQEVLRDGENAIVVDDSSPDAWRRAISRLLADDTLRARLARNAQIAIREHYTWDARARVVLTGLGLA